MVKHKVGLILLLFLGVVACGKEKNPVNSFLTSFFQPFQGGNSKDGLGSGVIRAP